MRHAVYNMHGPRGIMPNEVSQTENDKWYVIIYMESKHEMNKYQYNKTETDSQCGKQSGGYQWKQEGECTMGQVKRHNNNV